MMRERTFLGIQRWLMGLCVVLTLLFLIVFFPLRQRDKQLEQEVYSHFSELVSLNRTSPYQVGLDAQSVRANLEEVKPQIRRIRNLYLNQIKMLELPDSVQKRVKDPFQTFEYILARNELSAALSAKAKEKKVALDPSVLNGLPEYRYGMPDPQSLWIRLHSCERILNSMIDAVPTTIQSFSLLLDREYYHLSNTNGIFVEGSMQHSGDRGMVSRGNTSTNQVKKEVLFIEIPANIKFVGNMESVISFLRDFQGKLPPSMELRTDLSDAVKPVELVEEGAPQAAEPASAETQKPEAPQQEATPEAAQGTDKEPAKGVPPPENKPAEAAPAKAPDQPAPPPPAAPAPAPTPAETPEAAPAAAPEGAEPAVEPALKNSLFLGPFELHISPDNPDHVVLNAIVSIVFRLPQEGEK